MLEAIEMLNAEPHTGLRSSVNRGMAVRKSTGNGNVSSPAQGMKGGRAECAIHTHSLLKVSAGRMHDTAKLIQFLPGGKKPSAWDHYVLRSRTRTTQPKASVSSDNRGSARDSR